MTQTQTLSRIVGITLNSIMNPTRGSNIFNYLIEAVSASVAICHPPIEQTRSIAFDEETKYQKKFN